MNPLVRASLGPCGAFKRTAGNGEGPGLWEPEPSGYPRPRSSASLPVPWRNPITGILVPQISGRSTRGESPRFLQQSVRVSERHPYPERRAGRAHFWVCGANPCEKGGVLRFTGGAVWGKRSAWAKRRTGRAGEEQAMFSLHENSPRPGLTKGAQTQNCVRRTQRPSFRNFATGH